MTRRHPPVEGQDATDHATFHPGIWLAFGDLDGEDYWRLAAPIRHAKFIDAPTTETNRGSFAVQNVYGKRRDPQAAVCDETCRITCAMLPEGYLLVWDSLFVPRGEAMALGDQEEMGLGVRLATPLTVKAGGAILDDPGRRNEKGIWGHQALWCDYSGTAAGIQLGVLVVPAPANFRASRFHARDYGLVAANPFGEKVFGAANASRVEVAAGEQFRLRFAVLVHGDEGGAPFQTAQAYQKCLAELARLPRPAIDAQ